MDQESIDYFSKKVDELIDGIDKGDFSKQIIPDKYRWEHLLGLFILRESLDGGQELFEQLYDLAIRSAKTYLCQKKERDEKIKVAFQTYSAAQWPSEQVYRFFEKRDDFETSIVVSPLIDRNQEDSFDTYKKSLSWFKNNSYKVVEGIDFEAKQYRSWEEMGEYPDVLYQLSPWFQSLPTVQWFCMLPLRCLVAYIPYGIHVEASDGTDYLINGVYNKEFVNVIWRVYCDSTYNLKEYQKYQLLKGKNVRYSGYAKMDYFYEKHIFNDDDIRSLWRIPDGRDVSEFKKVIIAPHFTVMNHGILHFSTFHKNAWFLLYLAQKYKDKVSFVFKPHPNLRSSAVKNGVFGSYEEYDSYISRWNELPNSKVVEEASYLEYFETADAMIMDSISFTAEFLYTDKPLLFLTRKGQCFNEMGTKVVESYYRVPGENYNEIEQFLRSVVIEGDDPKRSNREEIFAQFLDYKSAIGVTASEFICRDLLDVLNGEDV